MTKLNEISNENKLNVIEQSTYDKFNNFIFSNDLKLTGKLLHRFEHFLNIKDLPGGVILFDEYEYHKFNESTGVEKFLKERNLDYTLKSTNWLAPTAYMIKKGF